MIDLLAIEYRRLDEVSALRWNRNAKRHDIGALVESIRRHGFIDPPGWDSSLNGGRGGLLYGNGRDEALEWMYEQHDDIPRGVLLADDGMWLIPVKVGVNQASEVEAEAAAIAHNNLTLSGGDFTAFDMARMWGPEYIDILAGLATADALPVTVDGDALDALINRETNGVLNADDLWKGMPDFEQEGQGAWKSIRVNFANEEDYKTFAELIGQALTERSNFIWYPYQPTHGVPGSMQGYVAENES